MKYFVTICNICKIVISCDMSGLMLILTCLLKCLCNYIHMKWLYTTHESSCGQKSIHSFHFNLTYTGSHTMIHWSHNILSILSFHYQTYHLLWQCIQTKPQDILYVFPEFNVQVSTKSHSRSEEHYLRPFQWYYGWMKRAINILLNNVN